MTDFKTDFKTDFNTDFKTDFKAKSAAAILGALFLIGIGTSCSNETKAAPTKAEITVDPNLYSVEHPELFKLVTAETRQLPTLLAANGSVTPDVNRTIHVTSQGSGRVVELRVRLGDSVRKGQILLSIHSADLAAAFSDYRKAEADERLAKRRLIGRSCSTHTARWRKKTWSKHRTQKRRLRWTCRILNSAFAY
jgi:multidrug efflux pump subunit AcrA (membrane-fusion protein)